MKKFFKFSKKSEKIIALSVLLLVCITAYTIEAISIKNNKPDEVLYSQFLEDLEADRIDTVYYSKDAESMRYTLFNEDTRDMTLEERKEYEYEKEDWRYCLYPAYEDFRRDVIEQDVNMVVKSFTPGSRLLINSILTLILPALIFVGFMVLFTKRGIVGKVDVTWETSDIKFADVIGHNEVVEELQFVVDLMKDEGKGKKLEARLPKGILFEGASGTGKTLLAKAVAGECGVPFFYINASSLIETYIGTGAKRIRQIFSTAKSNSPCVVFIDEIDAVGDRSARGGDGASNSEYRQTINALLQEMDGFKETRGVFVIGATNHAETLDKALLRAGRFDRRVVIAAPRDWTVRKELFEHFLRGINCEADLETVAKQTVGFTGADISAVVNESKLLALRHSKECVFTDDIEEAIDKHLFKGNRSSREKDKLTRELVAYHEAGHAVMSYLCNKPIARASIVGTTAGVGGMVIHTDDDKEFKTKSDIESEIKICYAGRCSESIKFKDVSYGASSDIQMATDLLMGYVGAWGFSEQYGMLDMSKLVRAGIVSKCTEQLFKSLANRFEGEALELLKDNYNLVELVAKKLLEMETLSGEAIVEILSME